MPLLSKSFLTRIAIVDRATQFLELEATVRETHTASAQVTDHPVENSTDITDHIRRLPEELQLEGIVSDTPILVLAAFRATPAVPGTDPTARAKAAYEFLRDIKDQGRLVDVSTKLRDYSNMAITNFSVSRDKDTSNILAFSLTLREIQIATTEVVAGPALAKGAANRGKKAKALATPPVSAQAQSILTRLFNLF